MSMLLLRLLLYIMTVLMGVRLLRIALTTHAAGRVRVCVSHATEKCAVSGEPLGTFISAPLHAGIPEHMV